MKVKCSKYSSKDFLQKSLVSISSREYFQKNASGSQKNMPKINQPIVLNTMIALPPYEEQKEIVKKIENLFAICDILEKEIESSKKSSERLMQVVLKEAFEK